MALAADRIRQLTRAFIGTRVYQGVLFWFALAHNITAFLGTSGVRARELALWPLAAILAAAIMGSYYRWRFGRVEPAKPARSNRLFAHFTYGVIGATALVLFSLITVITVFAVGREAGARPADLAMLLVSGATAMSLARSRGERFGWLVPMVASAFLLLTLVVPEWLSYRPLGHAAMAAALIAAAVQLHLFVVRGFRHAVV